jgi:alpha-amylase/alpha-mannosidase (GH57 family)
MRYLVVHAHLYQPPRENPWTEVIERQPSAAPFHDWNERISDECYERYGAAGVRGPDGRIVALVNLWGRISFNIGPTLAAWLEQHRPEVLADARAGWRAARERTGAGPALMQPYGHAILPLCDPIERDLQLAWGQADFRHRFGEDPRGIWFAETAVDRASLDAAAAAGLEYTVVAPEQVQRIRPLEGGSWEDVSGARVPPHRPYLVRLPSGRRITVFAFDSPLSRAAAFGGALRSGETLLAAFQSAAAGMPERDGVVLLAADGETFGHHQMGAEEALAEALVRSRMTGLAQVSHLGEVARAMPPRWEAELVEPSAWSCAHGVGRWERSCGCVAAHHEGPWNWDWRAVLRRAVRTLRDRVFELVERRGGRLLADPWAAAREFGDVVVHPGSPERVEALVERHAAAGLDRTGRQRAASMLELIRQTLFSATSCGWFFDDIAGLEAVQVLRHAARACELSRSVFGVDPEPALVKALADARGNEPGTGSGADIWRSRVMTARRGPTCPTGLHAVRRLEAALEGEDGSEALPPVASSFGVFAVNEDEPPRVERSNGSIALAGAVRVVHRRTGVERTQRYQLAHGGIGQALQLELEGEPGEGHGPPLREALVRLAAARAAHLLPMVDDTVLARLAWIGAEAQALGTPLPSPFPEALRGGARSLLVRGLETRADAPLAALDELVRGLTAARGGGLSADELLDLRPAVSRRLADLLRGLRYPLTAEHRARAAAVVEAAREMMEEPVLLHVRRWLVSGPAGASDDDLRVLAQAARMTQDALEPVDTPVRPVGEDRHDAVV